MSNQIFSIGYWALILVCVSTLHHMVEKIRVQRMMVYFLFWFYSYD